MSAISRKTCEENFQRSLMKWRKIRQYISHEFNTQMGSESNPAQRNEHQTSTESNQEGTESHSDFDSPQTTLDMDCERQQHAIQQPAPPAFRRWAKIRKQISESASSPPCPQKDQDLVYEQRVPILQPQKNVNSGFNHNEERNTNLDKIEDQLSMLLNTIKMEKLKTKRCYSCSTCSCQNGKVKR